ncbi:uncharacterized protein LOC127127642 [Lathyrus oleraceus]|uniref:uncharacterized protein LOC127127642 n=1 Tax=Pisum sativum TaxID=3888 RepID=UPI0021D14D26|nr:uncharacterized protein LOC127127642 [Pisum sativum]
MEFRLATSNYDKQHNKHKGKVITCETANATTVWSFFELLPFPFVFRNGGFSPTARVLNWQLRSKGCRTWKCFWCRQFVYPVLVLILRKAKFLNTLEEMECV